MTFSRAILACAAPVLVVVLAGCGGHHAAPAKSSSATVHKRKSNGNSASSGAKISVTNEVVKVKMTGKCRSKVNGGMLYPVAHGFTPNGTFTVNAWYPDGSDYTYLNHTGRVGPDGSLRKYKDPAVRWGWACGTGANGQADPADPHGKKYTIQFVDDKSGASTPAYGHKGAVHFRVYPAK